MKIIIKLDFFYFLSSLVMVLLNPGSQGPQHQPIIRQRLGIELEEAACDFV